MSFFLFFILLVTGVLLMVYYVPSVERAYSSIQDITYVVTGGRFIRNMHRWAAHGMVVTVFLHMARVFYTGSYGRGRGLNWVIGVSLLLLTLLLSFTGYLLPWDQLAFWAVTIGTNIVGSMRELTDMLGISAWFDPGGFVKSLLLGGDTVGQDALIRFYLLHIVLLPLVAAVLMLVHLWRIRKDGGLSRPADADEIVLGSDPDPGTGTPGVSSARGEPSILAWPAALWAETAVLAGTVALLATVSFLLDAPLRDIADPSSPENPAKAPWYFLGVQELVSYSAFAGGIGIPLLYFVLLLVIPFVDREHDHVGRWFSGTSGRRVAGTSALFAIVVTVAVVAVAVQFGWLHDWIPGIPDALNMVLNPGSCIVLAYLIFGIRILRNTGSTRLTMISLFTSSLVGILLFTAVGLWFRGVDWVFTWNPMQMPGP
jgi:quinol-cytochrome oxidoreductase complex cytochrome b subunit